MLGPDADLNSPRDREVQRTRRASATRSTRRCSNAWPTVVEPTLTQTPPDLLQPGLARPADDARARPLVPAARATPPARRSRSSPAPARPILDRWFESEQLKATLATDAIIGAMASPSMPGTAYVLFHHVMGETNGKRGVWAYVRGGMGGLTQALAARRPRPRRRDPLRRGGGAHPRARTARPSAWSLANGDEFDAPVVASNADANVTFLRLLDRSALPPSFVDAVERISYASASLKINVALAELPDFRALPGHRAGPPASRHHPHLSRPGLHRARLRRRQVRARPPREPGARVHDPLGGRPDGRAARPAPDVDVRAVRPVRASRGHLGRASVTRSPTAASTCSTSTRRTSSGRSSPARC